MTVIELTRFRVDADRGEEMLAARPGMLGDFEADRTGFLGATLVELAEGEWLDVVRWRTSEDFAESRAKGANLPGIAAFFGAIAQVVSSEEGTEAALQEPPPVLSEPMRRAHDLLRSMNPPGITLPEARDAYLAWSERFPMPPGTAVSTLERDKGLLVVGPDVRPVRTVLHFHGGGYSVGAASIHREIAARISLAARARVCVLDYPLSPENPFPAASDAAVTAYEHLLEDGVDPRQLMISGDSAGGNLTLVTLLRLKAAGLPLPAAAVTMSAWTDLTMSGETMTSRAERDPMVSREQLTEMARGFLVGHNPRDPMVSPLFADLSGLPPLLIQVGTEEVLFDDSRQLAEVALEAGLDVTLSVTDGAPHIWQHFASFLPEAAAAFAQYGDFARLHVAASA